MLSSTGALLSETWSFFVSRWRGIGIGFVALSMLLAVNQAFFARQIDANIADILARTGLTHEQFEAQLMTLLRDGAPPEEVDRTLQALQNSMNTGLPSEQYGFVPSAQNAGLYFVISSMPLVFGLMAIALVILFVSGVFYMLLAVQDGRGADEAARQLPRKIVAVSLLAAWVFLRSLAWMPVTAAIVGAFFLPPDALLPALFVGIVAAIALASRYILAPVLLLGGQHGVLQSASVSEAKTKGMLLTILGSRLLLVLFLILAVSMASAVVEIVSSFVPRAGVLLWLMILELTVAFAGVFHVKLARGLMVRQR